MPPANKGGWKTCSRATSTGGPVVVPFDGRETAPPVVGAGSQKPNFEADFGNQMNISILRHD